MATSSVALSGGMVGFVGGPVPPSPGGAGYFGSDAWAVAYPEVLSEYYRAVASVALLWRGVDDAPRCAGGVTDVGLRDIERQVVAAGEQWVLGDERDGGQCRDEVAVAVGRSEVVAGEAQRERVVEGTVGERERLDVSPGRASERSKPVVARVQGAAGVSSDGIGLRRGKHYEKNKAKRELRKVRKVGRHGVSASGVAHVSAFADCDQEKVRVLREKQLDALIVENEWKKQQFSRKMWRSDAYLSSDNKRIFKSELEAEDTMLRLAKKRGVQGWAETVLSGSTESRQSVHSAWSAKGKTESVSADSSVSEEAREAKVAALETKVKALELEVDTYRMKYGGDSGYDESYEAGLFESW